MRFLCGCNFRIESCISLARDCHARISGAETICAFANDLAHTKIQRPTILTLLCANEEANSAAPVAKKADNLVCRFALTSPDTLDLKQNTID